MTPFNIEIPVADENENWLNEMRRRRGAKPDDDAPADPQQPPEQPPPGVDDPSEGEGTDEVSTDEEEAIAEAVAAYRSGEIAFDEALRRVAETSLTWQEAQILLADEDAPAPDGTVADESQEPKPE